MVAAEPVRDGFPCGGEFRVSCQLPQIAPDLQSQERVAQCGGRLVSREMGKDCVEGIISCRESLSWRLLGMSRKGLVTELQLASFN